MAGGYQVGIGSETKAFKQGIDSGIIEPLEDAQKELVKLGDSRGPEQLERAMKDAQDETKKLERETKDTADAIEQEYKRAYREAKDSATDGMGKARAATQEVTQEIGSNLGEAVSSIRGDLSDLGQVGQDTLGGLAASVAGMGPGGLLGALALAAGATGLGLVTAGMEEAKEKQEELNTAAAGWAQAYTDSAGRIVSAASVVAEINAIATDPEKYKQAGENAKNWGVDVSTAMLAMSGDATALAVAQGSLNARAHEAAAAMAAQEEQTTGAAGAAYELADSVEAGKAALEGQTEAMRMGQEQARNAAAALYDYATKAGTATDKVDDLGNKIITLPDGKEIVVDAKTKTAYEDIDALERKQITRKTIEVGVVDRTREDVERIIRNITAKTATIGVRATTGRMIAGG